MTDTLPAQMRAKAAAWRKGAPWHATVLDAFADAAEALERRVAELKREAEEHDAEHFTAKVRIAGLVAALEACRDYITGWDGCAPFDPPEPRSKRDREVRSVLEEARAALGMEVGEMAERGNHD